MCVCWFVCFISATRHLSTLRRCLRVAESTISRRRVWPRARARSGKCMHSESTRAHAVQLLNEKIAALMPFKNKSVRARAFCRIRNIRDFQKKGKKKTNMPLPKFSLQFAFSWSVYFSNRTELYSAQIEFAGPHGITENQTTYLHCGGEARAKKRARSPTTCRKASTGKTGADTGPEGCGSPAVFPSPCLGDGGRDGGKERSTTPPIFPGQDCRDTGRNGGKERHQSPEDGRDQSR